MTEHKKADGLPLWLTVTVVLVVLMLLVYNVVIVGPEGYPVSMMLGGLIGAYSGLDQLIKRRNNSNGGPPSEAP